MNDLIKRLQAEASDWDEAETDGFYHLLTDAALTIEKLQTEVEEYHKLTADTNAARFKEQAERQRLQAERDALFEEKNTLLGQLPSGMRHCTIQFKECAKGHGWLTATNWIQHDCPTCERDALMGQVAKLREAGNALDGALGGGEDEVLPAIENWRKQVKPSQEIAMADRTELIERVTSEFTVHSKSVGYKLKPLGADIIEALKADAAEVANLRRLLEISFLFVDSQAKAEHLLDGFKYQTRPLDKVVEEIRQALFSQ